MQMIRMITAVVAFIGIMIAVSYAMRATGVGIDYGYYQEDGK